MKLPVVDKQDIRFTRVSVNNVPIQASTFGVAQDRSGFLWFGTLDGLLRYDGYNVQAYKHDTGNPNSLTESEAKFVYKDRSGILWIVDSSWRARSDWTRLRTRLLTIGMNLAISRA